MSSIPTDPRHRAVAVAFLDGLTAWDKTDTDGSAEPVAAALEGLQQTAEDDPAALILGAYGLIDGLVHMYARKLGIDRLDVISHLRGVYESSDPSPDA